MLVSLSAACTATVGNRHIVGQNITNYGHLEIVCPYGKSNIAFLN